MTLLFRSKSCRLGCDSSNSPPSSSVWEETEDEEEDYEEDEDFEDEQEEFESCEPISTPFISPGFEKNRRENGQNGNGQVPSASASVFGVSPQSMQCSMDERGNSVPTILLMMQKHLYAEGGLQAEGIFRITAENSQEESVRNQLNKGIVPKEIDVHCSAGLIKAWFRELPQGVLDCLTPEQVMHCNTEDQCTQLVKLLPPMEAALLDWAINLMADVVQNEPYNKMNARNIAMVFAPNMTQMADPLTALIHAVQVMNFLKTLIVRTIQLREESAEKERILSSSSTRLILLAEINTNPFQSGS
ncbi:Rho GTPase-activating protein 3 [Bienertia sinuspersici]